jgi:predicted transcriptional regulator
VQSHEFKCFRINLSIENGEGNLTTSTLGIPKLNPHQPQLALLKHKKDWSNIRVSRRGKLDIKAEILIFCEQNEKTKTSIMYNTNLNYSQLKNQLVALTSQDLLAKKANKYLITEKGYRFLSLYAQLNDLLDEFNPCGLNSGKTKIKNLERDVWDLL